MSGVSLLCLVNVFFPSFTQHRVLIDVLRKSAPKTWTNWSFITPRCWRQYFPPERRSFSIFIRGILASTIVIRYSILGADFMDCSPTVFCSFTSLRYLTWESNIEFSAAVLDSVSDALPSLEALQVISCSLFPVLAKFKLPNIYRVILPPQVTNCIPFFLRHGSKITDVAMHLLTIDTTSIFALCPNMTHLTLNLTDEDSNYLPSFALDMCDMSYSAIHGSLAKLVIHKTKHSSKKEPVEWKHFFDRTDFLHFPALREPVQMADYGGARREIAASPWVKSAAMLEQHDIRLTDEAGRRGNWGPARRGDPVSHEALIVFDSLTVAVDTSGAVDHVVDAMLSSFSMLDTKHLRSLDSDMVAVLIPLLKANAGTVQKGDPNILENVLENNMILHHIDIIQHNAGMADSLKIFGNLGHLAALQTVSLHFYDQFGGPEDKMTHEAWAELDGVLAQAGDTLKAVHIHACCNDKSGLIPPDLARARGWLLSVAGKISV
ncbi:hypothetical protein C8J57DRAFT_1579516 [Mycena rebaudengoi]|nr:hypothetical protein C8J57DRAFT_1579516 [Mycena rebaudengoi]